MGVIQRQGLKNTIISYGGILLGFVSLLIIQPKFLKPEEIGLMRILINFSSLVAVFIPLGVGPIITRFFPLFRNEKNGHNGILGLALLYLAIGVSVVGILLFTFRGYISNQYAKESGLFVNYFLVVIPLAFIVAAISVFTSICNSLFKSTIPSFLNDFVLRILLIVLVFAYSFHWLDLDMFIYGIVAVYGSQMLALLVYILSVSPVSLRINWHILHQYSPAYIVRYGLLFVFVAASTLGLKYIDTIIMGKYLTLELVGIYSIAAFIPTIMEAPFNALDRISGSKLAQALSEHKIDEVQDIYFKSVRYLLLIGGLIFVGINVNIDFLLQLLPPKFHGGVSVVYIYSVGTFLALAAGVSNNIIFLTENYMKGALLMIGLVMLTIVNNILLIPILGMNGAALSITITSILGMVIRVWIVKRNLGLLPYDRKVMSIFILVVICFVLNFFLPVLSSPLVNILVRGSLFSSFYLGVVFYLKIAPELFDIVLNLRKNIF